MLTEDINKQIKHSFILPNGHYLAFRLKLGYRGNQHKWINTYLPKNYQFPTSKNELALLGTWNSKSSQHGLIADFDHLPKGYNSWTDFKEHCQSIFNSTGLVLTSPSGKVKVLFLVEVNKIDLNIAKDLLGKIVPPELYPECDLSLAGMSLMYLTSDIYQKLQDWLPTAPITLKHEVEIAPFIPKGFRKYDKKHKHKLYEGEITEPKLLTFIGRSKVKQQLFRILLLTKGLITKNGFQLSTLKLARELKCSDVFVQKCLKQLVKNGMLKVLDSSYKIGLKSITYVARKILRKEIKALTKVSKKQKQKLLEVPVIEDGQWDTELFKLAHKVKTQEQYFEIVESLEGIDKKDRLTKAHHVWERVENYRKECNG